MNSAVCYLSDKWKSFPTSATWESPKYTNRKTQTKQEGELWVEVIEETGKELGEYRDTQAYTLDKALTAPPHRVNISNKEPQIPAS